MSCDSDISMERRVIQYLHTLQAEYEYRNLKNSDYNFKKYTVN
jgi:glutaredoxin-related protein